MKKALLVIVALIIGLAVMVSASYDLQKVIITPDPSKDLEVKIWIDRGTGALYRTGENIEVFFRTNKDAYVAIYNIMADGEVQLLFPNAYDKENFIRGGRDYSLPTASASMRYRLQVGGAPGKEILQIVASTEPLGFLDRLQPLIEQQGFAVAEEKAENFVTQRVIPIIEGKEYAVSTTYFFLDRTVQTGKISVRTTPSDALVYIDGAYVGRSPITKDIDVGNHVLTIYKDGYRTETLSFSVREGRTETVSVTLVPIVRTYQFSLSSTPSGASVYINGTYRGNTPLQISLNQGTYNLRVERAGYRNYEERFTIDRNMSKNVDLVPIIQTHQLSVTSSPSGAGVYIDGNYRGRTPLQLSLQQGTYTLSVEMEGYRKYEERFTIDRNMTRNATLVPIVRTYLLTVRSNPARADVFIDGRYAGRTPFETRLDEGTYDVRISLSGYEDYEERVRMTTDRLIDARLSVRRASLKVTTDPSNARVFADGDYLGNSPLEVSISTLGRITIRVEKDGYVAQSRDLTITPGGVYSLDFTLEEVRPIARIAIQSSPSGARIFVNGRDYGMTNTTLSLDPGYYEIVLIKEGYRFASTIRFFSRGDHSLDFTLIPIE